MLYNRAMEEKIMIDMKKTCEAFAEYVKPYDRNNGKIRNKIAHIERTASIARQIAEKLELPKEDIELAELIGLLHDIGRFEQIKRYNTFADKDSINHGKFGVQILFEEGLIRKFIDDDKYDEIIKQAILNHNITRVPEGLDKKIELHSKIIRDADKTDIYYILVTENIQDVYCCDDMSNDIIKDEIVKQFKNHYIDYSIKEQGAETLIAHLAYVFDFNYDFGLGIIKQNNYINKLVNKYKFNNEDTYNKVQNCGKIANEYIEKRLSKTK